MHQNGHTADMSGMPTENRSTFVLAAALFEAGLVLVALAVGWLADVNPLTALHFRWIDLLWGVLAAGALFVLLFVSDQMPIEGLRRIKRMLITMLAEPLSKCRWYELFLLAVLVGFSEEVLFRGLVQPWMQRHMTRFAALVWSNVVFGLLHCITLLYGVLAGVMGLFLGWLLDVTGERRLLIPIVTHAVYDYAAFLWIIRAYRQGRHHSDDEPEMPAG